MDLENSYYKRIIYKKNAFDDLKTYIKINYNNKKICLVSSFSVPAEDVTKMLNALFFGSDKVHHFVARNNFDDEELNRLKNKINSEGYDLLIAFGGGKVCDVVKFFSNNLNIKYIVCPTVASSLAYFSDFCVNPYNPTKSFKAELPNKIFIQESIIKNSSGYTNISGLCFLNSLRAVYIEGVIGNNDADGYIYLGMEKLFTKLDSELTNILLCNEDSNLVLMDLFIDFGFFMHNLGNNFCLYNSYLIFENMFVHAKDNYAGKKMLVLCRAILSVLKEYLEINSFKTIEMPNFEKISKIIEKNQIFAKKTKNFAYFSSHMVDAVIKKDIIDSRESIYKCVCFHLFKIREFNKRVKSVYKYGIEISESFEDVMRSVCVSMYTYDSIPFIDFIAGSGILNAFIA